MNLSELLKVNSDLNGFLVTVHEKGAERTPASIIALFQQLKENRDSSKELFLQNLPNCIHRITHPTPWQTVLDFFKNLFHLGPTYADFHQQLSSPKMHEIRDYLSQQILKKQAEQYFSDLEKNHPVVIEKNLLPHKYSIGNSVLAPNPQENKQRYDRFCEALKELNSKTPLDPSVLRLILLACQQNSLIIKTSFEKASEFLAPLWTPVDKEAPLLCTIKKEEDGSWTLTFEKTFQMQQTNLGTTLEGLEIRTTTNISIGLDGSPLSIETNAEQVSV